MASPNNSKQAISRVAGDASAVAAGRAVEVDHQHLGAGFGQGQADSASDAAAASGDHGHLAGEVDPHCRALSAHAQALAVPAAPAGATALGNWRSAKPA